MKVLIGVLGLVLMWLAVTGKTSAVLAALRGGAASVGGMSKPQNQPTPDRK